MYCSRGGEIEIESHCAIDNCTLRGSETVLATVAANPLTMDCSHGEFHEAKSCLAIHICTLRLSVTGPTTGLSNP